MMLCPTQIRFQQQNQAQKTRHTARGQEPARAVGEDQPFPAPTAPIAPTAARGSRAAAGAGTTRGTPPGPLSGILLRICTVVDVQRFLRPDSYFSFCCRTQVIFLNKIREISTFDLLRIISTSQLIKNNNRTRISTTLFSNKHTCIFRDISTWENTYIICAHFPISCTQLMCHKVIQTFQHYEIHSLVF